MATESAVGVVDQTAAGVANAKPVDTATITTQAGATQYRQVVAIGDAATPVGIAPVDAAAGLSVNVTNPALAVMVANDATAPLPITGQVQATLAGAASGLPVDLGQQPMALSLPVAVARDQPPIAIALSAGPVPVAGGDGAFATLGTTQDATLYGDAAGSVTAQLRGINATLAQLALTGRQVLDLLTTGSTPPAPSSARRRPSRRSRYSRDPQWLHRTTPPRAG